MAESEPLTSLDEATPRTGSSGTPEERSTGTVLEHLRAVHELQSTLAVEQREESVLRAGTTAIIELVGLDCGVVLVDPAGGQEALRFGVHRGRRMAQHEIEIVARSLDKEILEVRSGKTTRIVLASQQDSSDPGLSGEPPAAIQSRDIGSVLVLGVGGVGRRDGVLILARRGASAFGRAELALAELLALQLAAHYERVRRKTESNRLQEEVRAITGIIQERNRELEALIAIPSTLGAGFDEGRHMESVLSKAAEVTGHAGVILYLVEPDSSGTDQMKLVAGIGDPAYVDRARQPVCRRGEGPAGKVWERGEAVVQCDLGNDPEVSESHSLRRAGYHRMIHLPLQARGRTIGVLQLLGKEERAYSNAEQHLARGVVEQVAATIHDTRLLADLMRHNLELEGRAEKLRGDVDRSERRLQGIRDAIAAADGSGYGDARLERFLPGAIALLQGDAGAVFLRRNESGDWALRCQHGFPSPLHHDMERDVGFVRRSAERREATVLDKAQATGDDAEGWWQRAGYSSMTLIPFRVRETVRGVVAIAGSKGDPADDGHRPVHAAVAALAGLLTGEDATPPPGDDTAPAAQPASHALLPAPGFEEQLVQAQKMESIGTLAGGIAHHFNNILACIMGYATHIKSLISEDHPIHAKASIIERQTERAAELTNQLRSFARGGVGSRDLVDLNQVVEETVSFLSKSIDPGITLEISRATDLPAVEADPGLLRQVLLNVAINARDVMPGGGRINFETRKDHLDGEILNSIPELRPGDYVVVEVSDTGPGMPPEIARRACEPFFTTKPLGSGTGLGLSVAYGIIMSHGGHLALSSAPGIGTAVSIYIPSSGRALPRPEATPDAGVETPRETPDGGPGRHARPGSEPGTATSSPESEPHAATSAAGPGHDTATSAAQPGHDTVTTACEPGQDTARSAAGPGHDTATSAAEPEHDIATSASGSEPDTGTTGTGPGIPAPSSTEGSMSKPQNDAKVVAGSGKLILIVDDEEALREMATDLLSGAGFRVETARDGVHALEVYRQHWGKVDLVILDMVMPRLGGLETFRRIRGMDRKARVLLYSGFDRNEQAQQAVREGAVGLLTKPFGKPELLQWVDKALNSN